MFPKIAGAIRVLTSERGGAWCILVPLLDLWVPCRVGAVWGSVLGAVREVLGATVAFLGVVLVAVRDVPRWQVFWNEEH